MTRLRFPHPLTLLLACIALGAVLSWVLPAGEYQRRQDAATGREVVVPGTYHAVEAAPVGLFEALVDVPKGMVDGASVIFFVFLVGGAFTVVDRTGALRAGLDRLVRSLAGHDVLVIPLCVAAFAAAGALENMQEEIIALVPLLLLLVRRIGFDDLTAVAISLGAAAVGSSFSPVNPFQVGIAQKLAELPLVSGAVFRTAFLLVALAIWSWGTVRHALRYRAAAPGGLAAAAPDGLSAPAPGTGAPAAEAETLDAAPVEPLGARGVAVLLIVIGAFALFIYGVIRLGWGFETMAAVFFGMGLLAGVVGRLGVEGTVEAFVDGFRDMAFAGLLIGFARAIYVVLADGRIVDTIVHGLSLPLAGLPPVASAIGMMVVHTLVHVPVPSVSGQAVLTMPILIPLGDILGITRQVVVLAYQYGAGMCEILTPTNGALMAIVAAAGVRYEDWLRFALPLWGALFGLGMIAVGTAMVIGLH